MSEVTLYSRSSIFESINILESHKIIERIGYTNTVKYCKGIELINICSLVQNSINNNLKESCSLVQKLDELGLTSPVSGYKKTSLSLKLKEKGFTSKNSTSKTKRQKINPEYQEYVGRINADISLGLIPTNTVVFTLAKWRNERQDEFQISYKLK